jgi:hypothetical protein
MLAAVLLGPGALLAAVEVEAAPLRVTFHPARPRAGDAAWVHVRGAPGATEIEGLAAGQPLRFFPYAGGHAALLGIDLELKPGRHDWHIGVVEPGREPRRIKGRLTVRPRTFAIQHLTVPPGMADPDPETERRAVDESARLRTLFRIVSSERLWHGPFTRPLAGTTPGTGFGSRRVVNGTPRIPHGGTDYRAARGTPVVAANTGRVALVAEFFFPGRLVVLDHGLGLYTLYFHLERAVVTESQTVERGEPIGAVGATGRATGPHLHFGAQIGPARVDPETLLRLRFRE